MLSLSQSVSPHFLHPPFWKNDLHYLQSKSSIFFEGYVLRTVITGAWFNRDSDRSHPPRLFSISGKARPDFILCALPLFCHSRVLLSPICWLAGVRRVGKSTLAKSLGEERMIYVNCDLPVTRDMIADPELFYRNCTHPVVVFDEVHQLPDPSMVLKIGPISFLI